MKKSFLLIMIAALLLSGCSSYTATGAYVGGEFGHVIGSAIGSIQGGRRGYAMGTVIGTVGGAVAGAAIGAAVEAAQERKYNDMVRQELLPPSERGYDRAYNAPRTGANRGFRFDRIDGTGQADDRIDFDGDMGDVPELTVEQLSRRPAIEIRHAAIYDSDHNGVLTRGEECTVVFEIMNNTGNVVYDIYPIVEDVTANRHVTVSPNLRVESIAPYQGVRYTATILGGNKLKDGEIQVRVAVAHGDQVIESQTKQFAVPTRKKL